MHWYRKTNNRRNSLKQVISKYYDNSYTRVVSTLIEEEVLTIDELQKLIQQIKTNKNQRLWTLFFYTY